MTTTDLYISTEDDPSGRDTVQRPHVYGSGTYAVRVSTKSDLYASIGSVHARLRRLGDDRYQRVAERVRGEIDAARGDIEHGDLDAARGHLRGAEREMDR